MLLFREQTKLRRFSCAASLMLICTWFCQPPTLKALDILKLMKVQQLKKGPYSGFLGNTFTRKGSRTLRKWINRPLVEREEIERRAKAVDVLKSGAFVHILDAFKQAVMKIGKSGVDLDRLLIKIHYSATYKSNKITRKDLYNMLRSFHDILELSEALALKE